MKRLSKESQRLVDALVKAAATNTDLQFYRLKLEKHVANLESGIRAGASAQYNSAQKSAKAKRVHRAALQEQQDANVVIISRKK